MKIIFIFFLFVFLLQCNDKNKILNAYNGEKELQSGDAIPFQLYQNYPNPFNPSTIIQYSLSYEMKILLVVYTEDWVKVETSVNKTLSAGTYRYTFNAEDLPSGEYYYVLSGAGYTFIRKMKLVK